MYAIRSYYGLFTDKVSPVPYDFDYSGFVDTEYAMPQEWTSIKHIYEREYLGYCRNDEAYRTVIDKFARKKSSVYETIQSCTYLSEKEKKKLIYFRITSYNVCYTKLLRFMWLSHK